MYDRMPIPWYRRSVRYSSPNFARHITIAIPLAPDAMTMSLPWSPFALVFALADPTLLAMASEEVIVAVTKLGIVLRALAHFSPHAVGRSVLPRPQPRVHPHAHAPHLIRWRASRGWLAVNVLMIQAVGYLCLMPQGPTRTTIMSPAAIGGLGAFAGLVSLPAVLFRAVATLDFGTVDPSIVLSLLIGKLLLVASSYALGAITADQTEPGMKMLSAGCFALLTTNSDDLGLGLPVLGAIFPAELVNMCFVLNALQSMVFNPIILLMLGVGASRRDAPTDGTPPASNAEIFRSVLRGLFKNHVILSVLIGLVYNVLFGGMRGATLPFYIDNLARLLGQAFGPIVLFMAGASNVGAFSQLSELQSAIMPIATVMLKSFLLPAIVLVGVSLSGGSKDVLDFAFTFASLPTAASTLVFANPYKPSAQIRQLLNAGLALGKLVGFPLLFLSAAIFKTGDVHDIVVIEDLVATCAQLACSVVLIPLLLSVFWYAPWRHAPLRLMFHANIFTLGYLVACLLARYTVEQTAPEYALVSFFRWAGEANILIMAYVRVREAQHTLRTISNKRSAQPRRGFGKDLEAPLLSDAELAEQRAAALRESSVATLPPTPAHQPIGTSSMAWSKRYLPFGEWTNQVHFVLAVLAGLLLTLPWYLLSDYPTTDKAGDLQVSSGRAAHSHLPLWLPYGRASGQGAVYAVVYALLTVALLVSTGYVLKVETDLKEQLVDRTMRRKGGSLSKDVALRLAQLRISHHLYVRFECLIFFAVTRYAISSAICFQLIFSDSLTGAMALMLLVQSMLANTHGLVLFFLFGLSEGVFAGPIGRLVGFLRWLSEVPAKLVRATSRKRRGKRSVVVEDMLDIVDSAATSTGFTTTNMWGVVRRATAAHTIQHYLRNAAAGSREQRNVARPRPIDVGGAMSVSERMTRSFKPASRVRP